MASQTASELLTAHSTLSQRVRSQQRTRRQILQSNGYEVDFPEIPTPPRTPSPSLNSERDDAGPSIHVSSPARQAESSKRATLPPEKKARMRKYRNYVPEEETIRNDYSQHYVDSGEWPQNWILGAALEDRFEEYPKQQRLLAMKKAAVEDHAHAPMYHPLSQISNLFHSKFDVILVDPPFSDTFTWDNLLSYPISSLGADPSYIWLWVGSGAGGNLERGREVLAKWGYRRCEDIVWVKTNHSSLRGPGCDPPTTSLLTRTKEHCLMGIRGTVRRSTDSWFVHCNIDTDVIIWEGDSNDPSRKPPEMYTLIENFCLGTRRLELFGRAHSLRRGWVTVGEFDPSEEFLREKGATFWERDQWQNACKTLETGKALVPNTPDIEMLRPKSPVRGGSSNLPSTPAPQPGGHHSQMHGMMQGNMVMNTPNPMMGGFPPRHQVMPGMMPMNVPMGMPMGMPMMNMNPAMQMMPMGMGMNPMGMQQYGPPPGMGMPMWMGMPEGMNPIMGNQMWMGDGSMNNNMGGWGGGDPNWHGGQ